MIFTFRRNPVRFVAICVGYAVFALTARAATRAEAPPGQEAVESQPFQGAYEDLTPQQKALVDDLYGRFSEVTGRELKPEEAYAQARLSARTTFEAVTHALSTTPLSDQNGDSLGTALDLIEHLEAVNGKVKGARGDQQFRIYVRLKPGANEILDRSREFSREGNNTVYHKGYPLNYRQQGGVPSIQFSLSPDGARADVDVDYRSSKFPAAIFNGHLSATNSDVRAGDNSDRHIGRWEGLQAWWRGFFGLPLFAETYRGEEALEEEFPSIPREGKKTIDVAVYDFLSSWLVEGKPNLAVAYLSERAYACTALEKEVGESFDYGMAPFQVMMGMKAINDALGKVESLEDVVVGVRLTNPKLAVVRQKQHAQFVLYGVPDDVAASFECANRTKIGKPMHPRTKTSYRDVKDFDYFGSTFYLEGPQGRGATLALLWAKERGYWKIVSYEVEPEEATDQGAMPDVRTAIETPELERKPGDPDLIAATEGFLEAWLVEKDIDKALGFVAPSSYPCVNLDLDPGEAPKATPEEQLDRVRLGLERSSANLGPVARLEDIIDGVEPWDPDVHIVTHPREQVYSLLGIPDWMAEDVTCQKRLDGAAATPLEARTPSYGRYYVSAFRFDTVAGETVALLLGWTRENGQWRIFSYRVVEP